MATRRYTGTAATVAQVDTYTPATVEIGDIFTLTVTGLDGSTHAVNFTATAATVANVTAGLTAAWNNDTNTLCTPITAADNTTNLTLTADTAGVAFDVTATTTDGGGNDTQTLSKASTTQNQGPGDWRSTDNWDGCALPGAGDTAYVEGATILYGLDQSAAGTFTELNITRSQIGSNPADGAAVIYLQCRASAINIGYNNGPSTVTQSAPINLDLGNVASTVTIFDTGGNSTMPAVRIIANSASTNIEVKKGIVGVAYEAGETATIGTLTASYTANKASDVDIFIGESVTLTTIDQKGGDIVSQSGCTTATIEAGTLRTEGTGTITTLNSNGGEATLNSSGTITTLNINDGGTIDFTKSSVDRTVTNIKLNPGGTLKHDPADSTFTNWTEPDDPIILTATAG